MARRRKSNRETFGGTKKIDAPPKDIARAIFGLPPRKTQTGGGPTGPYVLKDGKPVVNQPGMGESVMQQLKRKDKEIEAKKAKAKQRVGRPTFDPTSQVVVRKRKDEEED